MPGSDLLSHGECRTTIGAGTFHFRVRDGIGWVRTAVAARQSKSGICPKAFVVSALENVTLLQLALVLYEQASRAISTSSLHALLHFHIPPINLVVFQGPTGTL